MSKITAQDVITIRAFWKSGKTYGTEVVELISDKGIRGILIKEIKI